MSDFQMNCLNQLKNIYIDKSKTICNSYESIKKKQKTNEYSS